MTQVSAAEQLQGYKASMGEELGTVFHYARQKFLSLTILWDEFVTLFGTSERVALMNESGGYLAHDIYWQFLNGITLGITRLLDPSAAGKFKNLSLSRIVELCPQSILTDMDKQLCEINNLSKSFRSLRDKVIAHNDLDHSTDSAQTLEYASRRDVTKLLRKILDFLNTIEFHFSGTRTHIIPMGNRDALVHLLYLHRGALIKKDIVQSLPEHDISLSAKFDWPDFLMETENERRRYS